MLGYAQGFVKAASMSRALALIALVIFAAVAVEAVSPKHSKRGESHANDRSLHPIPSHSNANPARQPHQHEQSPRLAEAHAKTRAGDNAVTFKLAEAGCGGGGAATLGALNTYLRDTAQPKLPVVDGQLVVTQGVVASGTCPVSVLVKNQPLQVRLCAVCSSRTVCWLIVTSCCLHIVRRTSRCA